MPENSPIDWEKYQSKDGHHIANPPEMVMGSMPKLGLNEIPRIDTETQDTQLRADKERATENINQEIDKLKAQLDKLFTLRNKQREGLRLAQEDEHLWTDVEMNDPAVQEMVAQFTEQISRIDNKIQEIQVAIKKAQAEAFDIQYQVEQQLSRTRTMVSLAEQLDNLEEEIMKKSTILENKRLALESAVAGTGNEGEVQRISSEIPQMQREIENLVGQEIQTRNNLQEIDDRGIFSDYYGGKINTGSELPSTRPATPESEEVITLQPPEDLPPEPPAVELLEANEENGDDFSLSSLDDLERDLENVQGLEGLVRGATVPEPLTPPDATKPVEPTLLQEEPPIDEEDTPVRGVPFIPATDPAAITQRIKAVPSELATPADENLEEGIQPLPERSRVRKFVDNLAPTPIDPEARRVVLEDNRPYEDAAIARVDGQTDWEMGRHYNFAQEEEQEAPHLTETQPIEIPKKQSRLDRFAFNLGKKVGSIFGRDRSEQKNETPENNYADWNDFLENAKRVEAAIGNWSYRAEDLSEDPALFSRLLALYAQALEISRFEQLPLPPVPTYNPDTRAIEMQQDWTPIDVQSSIIPLARDLAVVNRGMADRLYGLMNSNIPLEQVVSIPPVQAPELPELLENDSDEFDWLKDIPADDEAPPLDIFRDTGTRKPSESIWQDLDWDDTPETGAPLTNKEEVVTRGTALNDRPEFATTLPVDRLVAREPLLNQLLDFYEAALNLDPNELNRSGIRGPLFDWMNSGFEAAQTLTVYSIEQALIQIRNEVIETAGPEIRRRVNKLLEKARPAF